MDAPKEDVFPAFKDGDTHITITGTRQYQLHSMILKSISPTFERVLAIEGPAKLTTKAIKRGAVIRNRLLMVINVDEYGTESCVLEAIPLDDEGRSTIGNQVGLDLENGRVVPAYVLAYEAVLGACYNIPIDLGDFENDAMADILNTALEIVEVAEYLDCVHIITKSIEAVLLATGQTLHQSIQRYPIAWLSFASRLRSRIIFREALIHGAGQFNCKGIAAEVENLPKAVSDILTKKAKVLMAAMQQAEMKILSYYPSHLQREKTVGRADKDNTGRASYANDVMSWIALTVLRHFFAQNLCNGNTHNAEDMGWEVVTAIMAGGDTYLNKPQLESFHNLFPMSRKGAGVVEHRLDEMKELIKSFVRDLAKNESQLDIRLFPVKHFTCTTVDIHDYPWNTGYGAAAAGDSSDEEVDGPEVMYVEDITEDYDHVGRYED
ncbi:hypothetical protein LTR08_005070 [Meristemomyces frigidus]|nr:hypothetical protein LTR08_005070 [Meristemomyces frigidus]